VFRQQTPLPGAPLFVGTFAVTAGPVGEFALDVDSNADAGVSSALPAIQILSFNGEAREVLEGTGEQVAEFASQHGGQLEIEVIGRITPEPVCRTYSSEDGQEVLRFPYTQRYTEDLEVDSPQLNTLWSPSGVPAPPRLFVRTGEALPAGYYGFEHPISEFTWRDAQGREHVSALWRIIGAEQSAESLKDDLMWCTASGEFSGCIEFSLEMSNRIFAQAVSTVSSLSRAAEKAKIKGLWRPKGKLRKPYFARAAQALRTIRKILSGLLPNRYICSGQTPPRCTTAIYPKAELLQQFDYFLKVKLPKGLQHLVRLYPAERKAFIAELNKQPDRYVSCSQ
jgi:hypothetical protein